MIQVFLGYRGIMGHLIKKQPPGTSEQSVFSDEVQEWCDANLTGPAWPVYVKVMVQIEQGPMNGELREGRRFEFCFDNERDATLFKLFWIGG